MGRIFALGFKRFAVALGILIAASAAALAQPAADDAACAAQPTRRCVIALALAAARAESNPMQHQRLLAAVAGEQGAMGASAEMHATITEIDPDPYRREPFTLAVIDALARAGRFDDATALADDVEAFRSGALFAIAAAYAHAGRMADAEATFVRLGADMDPQAAPIREAVLGRADAALRGARGIADATQRDNVLFEIVVAHANAGRGEQAAAAVRAVTAPTQRAYGLAMVADIVHDPALAAEAAALARGMAANESSSVLMRVAHAQAGSGRVADAARSARAIAAPGNRAVAMAQVARVAHDRALTDEAREAAAALSPASERDRVTAWVAPAMVADGRPQEALALARAIATPRARADALMYVANALAEAGQAPDAVATALGIDAPYQRGVALIAIVPRLPQ